MQTAADWLQLLGYLFLLGGVLYTLYQLLPEPDPEPTARPEPARNAPPRRPPAELGAQADPHEAYAAGHARRVADLALALALASGYPESEAPALEAAALLHDVGAIDFVPELYHKPARLSQPELFQIWHHAARGARKAFELTGSQTVSQLVRWHHERWDGLGYPDGLVGEEIPLGARILRLAESAEAMLQPRPYRQALSADEAIAEINRLTGVAYDPFLSRIFVDDVLPRYVAEQEAAWRR